MARFGQGERGGQERPPYICSSITFQMSVAKNNFPFFRHTKFKLLSLSLGSEL